MPACDCMCVHYIACKYIAFVCQFEKRMKVLANGGVSMPPHWACVSVGVHMCGSLMCMCSSACMFMAPSSFTLLSSGGNVTPVPGIATSLDPGNSNDRNRRLLPLRHTRCLATGSPHTRPKRFQKASSSFIAIPAAPLPSLFSCFSTVSSLKMYFFAILASSPRHLLLLLLPLWFISVLWHLTFFRCRTCSAQAGSLPLSGINYTQHHQPSLMPATSHRSYSIGNVTTFWFLMHW